MISIREALELHPVPHSTAKLMARVFFYGSTARVDILLGFA